MAEIQEKCGCCQDNKYKVPFIISDQDNNTIVKKCDRCFGETNGHCKICKMSIDLTTGKQLCDSKLWICNTCYSKPDIDEPDLNRWECQSCHRVPEISLFLKDTKSNDGYTFGYLCKEQSYEYEIKSRDNAPGSCRYNIACCDKCAGDIKYDLCELCFDKDILNPICQYCKAKCCRYCDKIFCDECMGFYCQCESGSAVCSSCIKIEHNEIPCPHYED